MAVFRSLKASLLFLVLMAAFSTTAWAMDINLPGPVVAVQDYKVLKNSNDVFLAKNKDGREVVLVKIGSDYKQLGMIGKFRRGTELYHWGEGTPEQAASWDKAGRIDPTLLARLKKEHGGAIGGGFYASLNNIDSINYGNVQIVIEMPKDVKALVKTADTSWYQVIPDLEKLGISAIQHSSAPTWFNFIDAEALTKEHVTKPREWKNTWEKSEQKSNVLEKFPEIFEDPSLRLQVVRYLHFWKMLGSADGNTVFEAYKYFNHIQDTQAKNIAFQRLGSQHRQVVIRDAIQTLKKSPETFLKTESAFSGSQAQDVLQVYEEMIKHSKPSVRRRALELLGNRQDLASLKIIKLGFADQNQEVRMAALKSLNSREFKYARPYIEKGLHDSSPEVVKATWELVKAMTYKTSETIVYAQQRMKSSDINIRKSALAIAAPIDSPEATALLIQALRDTDPEMRREAIDSLMIRKFRKTADFYQLVEIATQDSTPTNRLIALSRLRRDSSPTSFKINIAAVHDPDKSVVLQAMGNLKDDLSEETLRLFKSLLNNPDPEIREKALSGIRLSSGPDVYEILQNSLRDPSELVQGEALEGLMLKEHPQQIEYIKMALNSEAFKEAHMTALQAIVQLEAPASLEMTKFLVNSSTETELKGHAIQNLYNIPSPEVFQYLKELSTSSNTVFRERVMFALTPYNTPEALQIIHNGLNDSDFSVRHFAKQALERINAKTAQATSAPHTEPTALTKYNDRFNGYRIKADDMLSRMCSKVFLK
ncbi:MAG: HEAT repeat domain-containing protein [Bdellovibrio sp.]|nr:HEAT repeat domain-containing protein [Bdellovibrio sp.]